MITFPYKIPEGLVADVASGRVLRFGAILKDVATGQIVGHMQPTSAFDGVVRFALGQLDTGVSGSLNPFGIAAVVQNQKIIGQLKEIDSSLGILQGMQFANLALTGLGIGVSVVGFAAMSAKLKVIHGNLEKIEHKIDSFREEWREANWRDFRVEVKANLDDLKSLQLRKDKRNVARDVETGLAKAAAGLLERYSLEEFSDRIAKAASSRDAVLQIDHLWSTISVVYLYYDAALSALFAVDELEVARAKSRDWAERVLDFRSRLDEDAISRGCANADGSFDDLESFGKARADALESAQALVGGLDEIISLLSSRELIINSVIESGMSGPKYISLVANKRTILGRRAPPLLYFPVTRARGCQLLVRFLRFLRRWPARRPPNP